MKLADYKCGRAALIAMPKALRRRCLQITAKMSEFISARVSIELRDERAAFPPKRPEKDLP
jgi:hypothetical protein